MSRKKGYLLKISGQILSSLIFVALFLTNLVAWGQAPKFTVGGTVVEEDSGEPVQLVNVVIDSLKIGASTNLDGYFQFSLTPGTYVIGVKAIGYLPFLDTITVENADIKNLSFKIKSKTYAIKDAVVIKPKENPALRIIRNCIRARDDNRSDRVERYECDAYNKTTITLNNISSEKLNSLLLRPAKSFVLSHKTDSAIVDSNQKYKLGLFIAENISKIYYKKPTKKQILLGAQTTGIESYESNTIQDLLRNVDIYENNINILERDFISPIASGALMSYRYYLFDTLVNGIDSIFGINIVPRRTYDRCFIGKIYIENSTWAVKKVDMRMNEAPNVNFIENIRIRQEFEKKEGYWLPSIQDVEIDFKNKEKNLGLIGRTATFFDHYEVNKEQPDSVYAGEVMEVAEDAFKKDTNFWKNNRLSTLEHSDQMAYGFIDHLKTLSIWKFYTGVIEFVSSGKKRFGLFNVGPYLKLFSYNPVEGARFQLGVYTHQDFPQRWYMGAHIAYGTNDKRFKYDAEVRYRLNTNPRVEVSLSSTKEVEQTGFRNYELDGTGFLNTALMRVPLRNLNYYTDQTFSVKANVSRGLVGRLFIKNKSFEPAFPLFYARAGGGIGTDYTTTEFGLSLRISIKEDYVLKKGERVYTGSKYPTFYLDGSLGVKGLLGGEYDYKSVSFTITDKIKSGRFGWMNYTLTAGAILGVLPYPSLYVYKGSQSFVTDPNGYYIESLSALIGSRNRSALFDGVGFNLMYFYEFVSDRYVLGAIDYHPEGYFFNKVPGLGWVMRKLKWKELFTFRTGYGTLTSDNVAKNTPKLPSDLKVDRENLIAVATPDKKPYMEIGTGIENIFKFIRLDFIWRLSYKNPIAPKSLRGWDYNFGVRVYVGITF